MRNNKKINKNRPAIQRLWLLKLGIPILLLCGMYFGIKYTIRSSYVFFPVKEIVFSGNKHLTGSELKVMMGLKGNESLIGLSGKVLAANLLKSPWVKAVGFRKDFPQRFQVRIEEAAPLALLEMNNRTFFIDDKGNLLEEIKSDSISFLPVISGDPFKNSSSFSEVLNLVKVIKGSNFINTKDRIEIIIPKGSGPEDISVRIDGILAKIGYGEYEAKLERLLELEDEIMRRGLPVDYIDLRFANRVIVKPINEVIR